MSLQETGNLLLKKHADLFDRLTQIPQKRPINYREDIENGKVIGKPRFINRKYQWPSDLLAIFHDHLQDLFDFFLQYSHWFDHTSRQLIDRQKRNLSQQSVKFLLEREVWATNEVYGAYLIEEIQEDPEKGIQQGHQISYYRFNSQVRTFNFPSLTYEQRKDWIITDAISQIQNQFSFLWQHLTTEIEVCMQEEHHKYPPIKIEDEFLTDQISLAKTLVNTSSETSLLILGHISEIWLLKALKLEAKGSHYLVSEAQKFSHLRSSDAVFFRSLRGHYNQLKHSQTYNIANCPLQNYITKFEQFLQKNAK